MITNDRSSIEDVLELARQITVQLGPLVQRAADTDGLCLRLAQAHALGLVDQLCEIAQGPNGLPAGLTLEDETRRAV